MIPLTERSPGMAAGACKSLAHWVTTRLGLLTLRVALLVIASFVSKANADDPDTFSLVLAYQYLDSLDEETNSPVFSSIVAYQFLDSLDEPGTSLAILSPVLSYQYLDWPGDANLQLQNSPTISYFYNIARPGP